MAHVYGGPFAVHGRRDAFGNSIGCYGDIPAIPNDMTLWMDGTRGITVDGTGLKCASWASRVGGHVAAQGTGGLQPALATQNGLACVQFDGVDDSLNNTSFTLAQPCTWFAVIQAVAIPGPGVNGTIIDAKLGTPTGRQLLLLTGGTPTRYSYSAVTPLSAGTADTNPHVMAAFFNNTSSVGYLDGAQLVSGTAGSNSQDGLTIGARGTSGGSPFQGLIAEVLAYPRQLTATEFAAVQAYLKAKWGTP